MRNLFLILEFIDKYLQSSLIASILSVISLLRVIRVIVRFDQDH